MNRKLGMAGFEYRELPLREIFIKAKELGFSTMEFGAETIMEPGTSAVKALMEEFDIGITAIGIGFWNRIPVDEVPALQESFLAAVECASSLGIPHVFTYFGGNEEHDYRQGIELFRKRIDPCLQEAVKQDVVILIENHFSPEPNEATATARTCLEFLEAMNSDYFKLNFDPANFYIAGEEAYPYAYDLLKEHIRTIHLKDVIKYDRPFHGPYNGRILTDVNWGDFICVPMGEGAMNFEGQIGALIRDEFSGPLTIELHVPHEDRDEALRKGLAYCENLGW